MRRKSIVSLALVVMMIITLFNVTLPEQAKTETKRQIVIFEDDVGKKDVKSDEELPV